jgi:hypothetical protein
MLGYNWHSVYMGLDVLLVECKGCGRRGAIGKEDSKRQMHQGNMDELRDAEFKCMRCGVTAVRAYIPSTQDQIDMFLAGDPAGTLRPAN